MIYPSALHLIKWLWLGMSAFLNISYTLIGQIVLPSVSKSPILAYRMTSLSHSYKLIAEMENPMDFPKGMHM
jgi:hypothetical protein